MMNNLEAVLKIFDLRYSILQERHRINDIDEDTYGFQLKKLDNELKELLNSIKEENNDHT